MGYIQGEGCWMHCWCEECKQWVSIEIGYDDSKNFKDLVKCRKKCPNCEAGVSKVKIRNLGFRNCHWNVRHMKETDDDEKHNTGDHQYGHPADGDFFTWDFDGCDPEKYTYVILEVACWRREVAYCTNNLQHTHANYIGCNGPTPSLKVS